MLGKEFNIPDGGGIESHSGLRILRQADVKKVISMQGDRYE